MSYEKLGFEKGQVLKAEHLNHMEDGIANSGGGKNLIVIDDAYELAKISPSLNDPAWEEIDYSRQLANMSFEDALAALRSAELTGASSYTARMNEFSDNETFMSPAFAQLWIHDISVWCTCDCLLLIRMEENADQFYFFWTADGFFEQPPLKESPQPQ